MKFEEPTSNTDISRRFYRRITILLILKTSYRCKMSYVRSHLKFHDYNDYTTLLSDLSPIDFDMVRLLN